MDPQQAKFLRMTQTPVPKLVCSLGLPCIVSMLVTSFYNMADTFFVGRLENTSITGAVGVVFSIMNIIQAVGFFCGHGSGNYISRELGAQNTEEASRMAATGVAAALILGGCITALGLIFVEPLAYLLGSTDTILPYAVSYLRIILIGAPYMCAALVLNNQLRFQGSAAYGMVGITAGAVLNIALDPLFIFGLGMGVAGAALATILSQLVSFCILLFQCSRGGNLAIHITRARLTPFYLRQIVSGGLPSLARQGLGGLSTMALNWAAGPSGDAAIAAMGVVARVMHFANAALIGFGQGGQPVEGFCYGAKLYRRVKETFYFCVKISFFFLLAIAAVLAAFAPQVVAIFRDDPTVVEIGALALRLQCLTLWANSLVVISNMTLQVANRTVPATLLAMSRQGIFFIPGVLLLPLAFDLLGVQMAQTLSDVLALALTLPLMARFLRELDTLDAGKM